MEQKQQKSDEFSDFNISQVLFGAKSSKESKKNILQQQKMEKQPINISSLDFNASKKRKIFKSSRKKNKDVQFKRVQSKKENDINWDKLFEDFDSEQDNNSFDGSMLENQTINLQFFSKDDEQQLIRDSQTFAQENQGIDLLEFIKYDQDKQKNKKMYTCKICKQEFTKAALGGHMTKLHPKEQQIYINGNFL